MRIDAELYDGEHGIGKGGYVEVSRDGRRPLALLLVAREDLNEQGLLALTPDELRALGVFCVDLAADLKALEIELQDEPPHLLTEWQLATVTGATRLGYTDWCTQQNQEGSL